MTIKVIIITPETSSSRWDAHYTEKMFCASPTTNSPKERKDSLNPRKLSVSMSYQEHWQLEIKADYPTSFLRTLKYWAKSTRIDWKNKPGGTNFQPEKIGKGNTNNSTSFTLTLYVFFSCIISCTTLWLLLQIILFHISNSTESAQKVKDSEHQAHLLFKYEKCCRNPKVT